MTVIALVSTKCGTFVTLNPKFEGWSYNFFQSCIYIYSLVILELLDELGPLKDVSLQLWYMDDRTCLGERSVIASLLQLMREKGPSYGLQLNMSIK